MTDLYANLYETVEEVITEGCSMHEASLDGGQEGMERIYVALVG